MQVTPTFSVIETPSTELKNVALTLVDGGWITPEMYATQRGDLAACIRQAVAKVAKTARPNPLAQLSAVVADTTRRAEIDGGGANSEYHTRKKCNASKVGAIVVHCATDHPIHRLIGPRIQALEALHAGLGHTVLYWLSAAFDKSSRACDPISGLGWAQENYWQGEADETFFMEEHMADARAQHADQQAKLPPAERTPFNEKAELAEWGVLSRADYDSKIPRAISSLNAPKLSLAELERIKMPAQPKTLAQIFSPPPDLIHATITAAKLVSAAPECSQMQDNGCFEHMRWEICPFLLRWQRDEPRVRVGTTGNDAEESWEQDHLGMIWDDFLNREYEDGDTNMSACAAWGWHDANSLTDAMQRFYRWCRLLQAAETILNLLQPEDIE